MFDVYWWLDCGDGEFCGFRLGLHGVVLFAVGVVLSLRWVWWFWFLLLIVVRVTASECLWWVWVIALDC